jgi:hypothetical protein
MFSKDHSLLPCLAKTRHESAVVVLAKKNFRNDYRKIIVLKKRENDGDESKNDCSIDEKHLTFAQKKGAWFTLMENGSKGEFS